MESQREILPFYGVKPTPLLDAFSLDKHQLVLRLEDHWPHTVHPRFLWPLGWPSGLADWLYPRETDFFLTLGFKQGIHSSWALILPERLVPCLPSCLHFQEMTPRSLRKTFLGPKKWQEAYWAFKKDSHTFQRDRERTYNDSFSKVNARR